MGAMTLIASMVVQKKLLGLNEDIEGNGFGIKYDMGGGMTIAAATVEVKMMKDKSGAGEEEKYTANIGEVVYTVAPGLKAKVTYTDYDYKMVVQQLLVTTQVKSQQLTIICFFLIRSRYYLFKG